MNLDKITSTLLAYATITLPPITLITLLLLTSCSPPPGPPPGTPRHGEIQIEGILENTELAITNQDGYETRHITLTFQDGTTYHGKLESSNQCTFIIGQHHTILISRHGYIKHTKTNPYKNPNRS